VEDDGPGIPSTEREKVFERFYRLLGNNVPGSGLGLAIVKEIVQAHDAEVSINCGKDNKGTIAQIRFPTGVYINK
jgi:two-component system sensor histidine kinase TctE